MICEEPRVPALPGEEDVTDGSVDYYDTDWQNVENGALESEMQKCASTPCSCTAACPANGPTQTDVQTYEIVQE